MKNKPKHPVSPVEYRIREWVADLAGFLIRHRGEMTENDAADFVMDVYELTKTDVQDSYFFQVFDSDEYHAILERRGVQRT